MIKQINPLLFLVILVSCSKPGSLTPEKLNKYIMDEEHGLSKKVEVNGYDVQVKYRPTDLLVEQEISNEIQDTSKVSSLRSKYNRYYYFILSLSHDKQEALDPKSDQFSELVQTLSFRMNNYVNLTTASQDTIPTADFILNRTYGFSESTELLFVFSKEKSKGKDWLQFNLNEFGLGIGNQRFRFKIDDLEHAPKIDFHN
jgi:hypothetical protein